MDKKMEWLIYTLVSLLSMGVLNVVLKLASEKISAFLMVFLTGLFASMFLFPIVILKGKLNFSSYGLIAGLLWSFSIVCLVLALSKAEMSRVMPITSLSASVSAIVGIMFLGESITPLKTIGIILSAVAIILLSI